MDQLDKLGTLIVKSNELLGKKIDGLANQLAKEKPPVVNVAAPVIPPINVPEANVNVQMPEFPPYPDFPEFPKIELPPINVPAPEVTVNVPPIEVPEPKVTVNVPPANITVEPTPVTFPDEMKVKGLDDFTRSIADALQNPPDVFGEVSSKRPLPIMVIGGDGKQITSFGGEFSAPSIVGLKYIDASGIPRNVSPTYKLPVDATFDTTGLATSDRQDTGNTSIANVDTNLGAKADTSATTDTGSFSLIALFKRLLEKLTSGIAVTGTFWQATQPVSAASLPLPSGASTEATLALIKAKTDNLDVLLSTRTKPADTQTISGTVTANAGTNLNTSALALESGGNLATLAGKDFSTSAKQDTLSTRVGDVTEAAPATDTASSGLNGRLQRIAQRITSLIALFPTALTASGNFKVAVQETVATSSAGDVASGSADSGNPVKQGFQARTTNPTAVTDGQRVNGVANKLGHQVVVLNQVRDLKTSNTVTITDTTETTVLSAIASTFLDITHVMVANTSNSDVRVDFRDTTAGTVRFSIMAKAGTTSGFTTTDPVLQTTVNTNWTVQAANSVTDLRVFMKAIKTI